MAFGCRFSDAYGGLSLVARGDAHRDPDPIFMKLPGPSCPEFFLNSEKKLFKFHLYQVQQLDVEELGKIKPKILQNNIFCAKVHC